MSKYFPPKCQSNGFHCPHCNIYANQIWGYCYFVEDITVSLLNVIEENYIQIENQDVEVSRCSRCQKPTFWSLQKIIYPPTQMFPPPNDDLNDDVKKVYEEAATIAGQSPRAACALLRLAIQLLLKELGQTGTINEGIKKLVVKGLDPQIQQSLDIVRVTGNNAVHPGVIDFKDTTDVLNLFELINVIAEALITQPKRIQEMYENLPDESRQAIERRDGN